MSFEKSNGFGGSSAAATASSNAHRLKAVLAQAVSPEDLTKIANALVSRAKRGSVSHAREVLDRLLGKPSASVEVNNVSPYAGMGRAQLEDLILAALVERGRIPPAAAPTQE